MSPNRRLLTVLLLALIAWWLVPPPLRAEPDAGPLSRDLDDPFLDDLFLDGPFLDDPFLDDGAPPERESVERRFDPQSHLFHSAAMPAFELSIPRPFEYLGRLEFPLRDTAWVDRHVFARRENGRLRALVVLQFEGFLDGVEGSYRFQIPAGDGIAGSNYRFSPERIDLGHHGYVHNTWAFDWRAGAAANPGMESDRTMRFLEQKGLDVDAGWIMSRFVREVGADRRHELILFYLEPLGGRGLSLTDFPDGGPVSARYDELSETVTAESLEIFSRLEGLNDTNR